MPDKNDNFVMTPATTPAQIEKALAFSRKAATTFVRQRMSDLSDELEEWNALLYRLEGND